MSELQKVDLFILCHGCRNVYSGNNVNIDTPCPECGDTDFVFIRGCGIVDAVENEMALEAILDHSGCEVVQEVASVMGYHESGGRDTRNDATCLHELKAWLENQD